MASYVELIAGFRCVAPGTCSQQCLADPDCGAGKAYLSFLLAEVFFTRRENPVTTRCCPERS